MSTMICPASSGEAFNCVITYVSDLCHQKWTSSFRSERRPFLWMLSLQPDSIVAIVSWWSTFGAQDTKKGIQEDVHSRANIPGDPKSISQCKSLCTIHVRIREAVFTAAPLFRRVAFNVQDDEQRLDDVTISLGLFFIFKRSKLSIVRHKPSAAPSVPASIFPSCSLILMGKSADGRQCLSEWMEK